MKWILRYLVQGLLVAVPIVLTFLVIVWTVAKVDGFLMLPVPGLGLVITLAFFIALGFLASSVVGTRLIAEAEQALQRLPLVKILYNAIKDLIGAFVGNKKSFNRPVAIDIGQGVHVFGFATRDALPIAGFEGHVAVYLPQSYNFAGNIVIVRREAVTALDVRSSEVMTFVVSGGISGNLAAGRADADRGSVPPPPLDAV
jgi:uncharacterized membrane protein